MPPVLDGKPVAGSCGQGTIPLNGRTGREAPACPDSGTGRRTWNIPADAFWEKRGSGISFVRSTSLSIYLPVPLPCGPDGRVPAPWERRVLLHGLARHAGPHGATYPREGSRHPARRADRSAVVSGHRETGVPTAPSAPIPRCAMTIMVLPPLPTGNAIPPPASRPGGTTPPIAGCGGNSRCASPRARAGPWRVHPVHARRCPGGHARYAPPVAA